ncbi:hypothetical protein ACLF8C_00300 [Helicobacter pylori]
MSGAHIVENTNTENTNISRTTASTPPPNNEELLKSVEDLKDCIKKLEDKLEHLEPLIKISRCIGRFFRKSSNDTQENSKDAQKFTSFQEKYTKPTETTELTDKNQKLTAEKENLTKDKENLTTELSTAKSQAEQTSQKLNELERRHAPCQKLEKLYEAFLEVKGCLNFNFVATTYSPMDLIASVLSDSKYYLESLYDKVSQELSDKKSGKGEKLAELFDLLFEYIKDSKFERLKEPSAYDHTCKKLYPEQNTSQKMQRVVLRGYKHNNKVYYTIVDMGS